MLVTRRVCVCVCLCVFYKDPTNLLSRMCNVLSVQEQRYRPINFFSKALYIQYNELVGGEDEDNRESYNIGLTRTPEFLRSFALRSLPYRVWDLACWW